MVKQKEMNNKRMMMDAKKLIEGLMGGGLSQSKIATGVGVSTGTINRILKGTYPKDGESILTKLKSYYDATVNSESKLNFGRDLPFVETSVFRAIDDVLISAKAFVELAIVYSEAGYGKTMALEKFKEKHPESVLITANTTYTPQVFFAELSRALGGSGIGRSHALMEEVIGKLKGTKRMLLIDEANKLSVETLELVRNMFDVAKIGVAIVGQLELRQKIEGSKGSFKQLWSRVDACRQLPAITDDDVALLVKTLIPDATPAVIKTFAKECNYNTRVLSKLIKASLVVAYTSGKPVDSALIVKAGGRLLYKGL